MARRKTGVSPAPGTCRYHCGVLPPHPPPPGPVSPCVRNCCLDEDNVCLGCGRTLEEIMAWSGATAERKQEIVAVSRERAAAKAASRNRR